MTHLDSTSPAGTAPTGTDPARTRLPGGSSLLSGLPGRQGFGDASLIRVGTGSIDLGGGNPDRSLLPVDLYREAVHELMDSPGYGARLGYVPAAGTPSFRALLAEREGVSPERIIVTSGGINGLAVAVLGTLDPGDTIVVDDPIFPLFLRVLDLVPGVRVVPVGVQADGLDVDELESHLAAGVRPQAVFTVPTFHNPGGAVLSAQKAQRLTELAERWGFTVFADDPYRELAFPGAEVPAAAWVRDSEHVIGVNTFSKTLGPALRLGYTVVPSALAEQYVKLRNRLDGQASGVLQDIVERIVGRPEYAQANAAAGAVYAQKARALLDALHRELPGELDIIEPQGGFFLWARFRDQEADFAALFDAAQDEGLVYQRGEWFGVTPTGGAGGASGAAGAANAAGPAGGAAVAANVAGAAGGAAGATGQGLGGDPSRTRGAVRLTFAELDVPTLEEGAARLGRAWRHIHG